MPSKFADLAKKALDTLNKGYESNHSAKVTTKASNGVTYTGSVNSKGNGKLAGKVGAAVKHSSGFNLKKLEIANNGTLASEVALEGAVDKTTFNLNVVMTPLDLSGAGEKCEVGLEYAHEKAQLTLAVSPLLPTSAALSVLIKAHENVLIGGSYAGQLDDTWTHTSDNVGIGYLNGDSTVTLTSASLFNKFSLTGFHQFNKEIAFAASVDLNRANPANAAITIGGSYQVDADTSVKAKINVPNGSTDGATASIGYNQKINANVRLTAASQVRLDPQDDLFGASFALGVEFGSI
jgi:hypothetical protein